MKLDKAWFYENLKSFTNKHLPIYMNISIAKDNLRYRIIYSWESRKPNGDFNPMMSCQLIDTTKQGWNKYVVPDLIFDCRKEGVTTDFKLYKFLSKWVENALTHSTEKGGAKVYKFTIEYYFEKYHTGDLNLEKTRTGVVFAKEKIEAISKVSMADNEYICIKNINFEEIKNGGAE